MAVYTRLAQAVATLTLAQLAASPAAGQPLPEEPAPPLFAEVSSQLADRPGLEVGKPAFRRAPSAVGPDSYRFLEYLPAHQQRMTFDLKKVTDADAVITALKDVRAALEAHCKPGKLQHRAVAPRITKVVFGQPTDDLMSAAYRRLHEDNLVGQFDCTSAVGTLAWTLTVLWDQGERDPTSVIPSDQWRFRLETISVERRSRQQARFDEFKRRADALRAKPDTGAAVQVLLDDLPGSIASQYGRPFNPDRTHYFVCGLVLSHRDGNAEVQFGKDRLALPTTMLYPIGTPVTVAEMGMYMEAKSPPHRTCLRA